MAELAEPVPAYAIKKGSHYRYYISAPLMRQAEARRSMAGGIPAADLESLVTTGWHVLYRSHALLDVIDGEPQSDSS
ncbi:MAG TPA: hypothetical protein VFQ89_10985, partial [Candidatus Binatia bacterium]|nr:hypothetical protein [Candidatus Binatia bacterium]